MKFFNGFNFREFITKNKETVQIIYGVFLIILIPALIAYNTYSNVINFSENLDTTLQREQVTVGRLIRSMVGQDLGDQELLQKAIDKMSAEDTDLKELSILIPDEDNFKTIASSKKEDIGKSVNFYFYTLAWSLKDDESIATDSLQLATTAEGKSFIEGFSVEDRFWLVAMPMKGISDKKEALLAMKISSKLIDDNAKDIRDASFYLLFITIIAVIIFLAFTVRIWDYAILYRKIKEVDQMKDEFISIASHELRTPLTVTKGYLSMILEGTFGKIENPEIEKALNTAAKSNNRLEGLVEDLLNVSRIEQGRFPVAMAPVELEPIIRDIVSQLKVNADEKKLILEYSQPDKKLPLVSADSERLRQVLINLIGNSVKYTEKGSVKVTTMVKNNLVEIKVVDTGIGMSGEEQKHLFEKFYRVQNEKTGKIVGTGLGLWITKQIIELMKGSITLESMEGVGTQVTVKLQAVK
ncbi:MAG: HAMP domain-containing sensor histidine kinase [bacterium]|nr:HAMP domain-containing sensor histidine kinase [bacterium]